MTKTLAIAATLLLAGAALPPATARADGPPLVAAVSDRAVYLYWGPLAGGEAGVELYRSEGDAPFERLALVTRITDPARAAAVLKESADALSQALTLDPDFHRKADANRSDDHFFSLASSGFARARGYAWLDATVKAGVRYRYRIFLTGTGGQVAPLAETSVLAGRPVAAPPPALTAELSGDYPALKWVSQAFHGYDIHRADRAEGPYARLTLAPMPPTPVAQPIGVADDRAPRDGRTVYYRIATTDLLGQPGPLSAPVPVATADRRAPSQPVEVSTTAGPGYIRVTWKRNADPVSRGYRVYRYLIEKDVGTLRDGLPEKKDLLTKNALPADRTSFDDRTALAEKVYAYTVAAVDAKGGEGRASHPALGRVKKFTPPSRPVQLSARVDEGGRIHLSWRANPEKDLYGYRLYKGVGKSGKLAYAREIAAPAAGPEPEAEEALDAKSRETYRYAVAAVDRSDNESALSEPVEVKLPDKVPPIAPIVTGLGAGSGTVTVEWAPSPDADVAGHHVYRKEKAAEAARLTRALLPAAARSYTDTTARAGVVYLYAVSASDAAGNESPPSEYRSTATFRKIDPLPPMGAAVTLDPQAGRRILTWQARDAARGYLVLGAGEKGGPFRQLGTLVKEPRFAVPDGVAAGSWLRVQAVYPGGVVSEPSAPAQVPGRQGR